MLNFCKIKNGSAGRLLFRLFVFWVAAYFAANPSGPTLRFRKVGAGRLPTLSVSLGNRVTPSFLFLFHFYPITSD
jgi:hypothetical protein